jgi:hypothetical protein
MKTAMNRTALFLQNLGLKRWEKVSNYGGSDYSGYFTLLGKNRDSEILSISNFEVAKKKLSVAIEKEEVLAETFSHWACGHFTILMVSEKASPLTLKKVKEIKESLSEYPVLDDDDYQDRTREEQLENFQLFGKVDILNLFLENFGEKIINNLKAQFKDFEDFLQDMYIHCDDYGVLNIKALKEGIKEHADYDGYPHNLLAKQLI